MSETENPPINSQYVPPENGMGDRIRERRKDLGLTVEELSALVAIYDYGTKDDKEKGIAVSTLYLYEKGERHPRAKELRLICDALNVPPTWLLLGQDWDMSKNLRSRIENIIEELYSIIEGDELAEAMERRKLEHLVHLSEVKDRLKKK